MSSEKLHNSKKSVYIAWKTTFESFLWEKEGSLLLGLIYLVNIQLLIACRPIVLVFHLYFSQTGIDILKLVAAQIGSQWKDIYQFLSNASERELAAFTNGYSVDHERAYAALQHWTIRGPEASLAQLISALRQHRRTDVVEKIRGLMEDTAQVMAEPVLKLNELSIWMLCWAEFHVVVVSTVT